MDLTLFQRLAAYAKENNVSLIGIINYHISVLENLESFTIPYPKTNGTIISDVATSADQTSYIQWVKNTEDYLIKNSIKYSLTKNKKNYTLLTTRPVTITKIEEATFKIK